MLHFNLDHVRLSHTERLSYTETSNKVIKELISHTTRMMDVFAYHNNWLHTVNTTDFCIPKIGNFKLIEQGWNLFLLMKGAPYGRSTGGSKTVAELACLPPQLMQASPVHNCHDRLRYPVCQYILGSHCHMKLRWPQEPYSNAKAVIL